MFETHTCVTLLSFLPGSALVQELYVNLMTADFATCNRLARVGFEGLDSSLPTSVEQSDSVSNKVLHRGISVTEDLRIPVSSGLLVELLSAIYYAM
jgi:hypothetical protein